MRILCDQNVAQKYREALEQTEDITVTTVADVLRHDAGDTDIAVYAETHDWVVFTTDDDFYTAGGDHGLLIYDQIEDPTPGDVVEAIQEIRNAYNSASDIVESVPDGWI